MTFVSYEKWEKMSKDEKMKFRNENILWNNADGGVYFFETYRNFNFCLKSGAIKFNIIKDTKTDEFLTDDEFLDLLAKELNSSKEPKPKKTVNLNLKITEDDKAVFDEVADELNMSVSAMIRHLVYKKRDAVLEKYQWDFCPRCGEKTLIRQKDKITWKCTKCGHSEIVRV